ncbi:MAG: hypothetical protein JSV52_00900 [Candidatus Zixiibacteriota bacterium]|nr:MAG: hypothetical protein JSV52_00900 [candidate division Zixibacteria bacterium]
MKTIVAFGLVCLILGGAVAVADGFDRVKIRLARSGCHYFEFYSIIESDIFDEVDTASGTAYIAPDGRYSISVADEHYVYDLKNMYTYSETSGQVIIEKIEGTGSVGEEIAFILRLDETYKTESSATQDTYRLMRIDSTATAYPDSLYIVIDTVADELKQMEYLDINEELNRIVFLKYLYEEPCDTNRFHLEYPDSAEVIRL